MDLNQLYFDHQLHLIRADGARSVERRKSHRDSAVVIARRIASLQAGLGALAACGWFEAARA